MEMIDSLRQLVIPPPRADGRPSTRKRKAINVQVFNKGAEGEQSGKKGKVSINVPLLMLRLTSFCLAYFKIHLWCRKYGKPKE